MRSFLFFGESKDSVWCDFETMKQLRVLDFGGVRFHFERRKRSLREVIGDLIHLRYIGIADTLIGNLPALISNLRFLQTLDVSSNDSIRQTIDLRKLTSLRHVIGEFLGGLLIGDAMNLQTLRSITSYSWSKLKHELLINLRDLEIYDYEDSTSVKRRFQFHVNWASLTKLRNLRVLKLVAATATYLSLESEEAVRSMDVISPSLKSVTLVGLHLEEDPMPFLQKLPRLEVVMLKICDYSGEKMSVSEQGFGRLRKLKLYMESLDELQIEEEAMPHLIQLKLRSNRVETKLIIPNRLRAFIQIDKN